MLDFMLRVAPWDVVGDSQPSDWEGSFFRTASAIPRGGGLTSSSSPASMLVKSKSIAANRISIEPFMLGDQGKTDSDMRRDQVSSMLNDTASSVMSGVAAHSIGDADLNDPPSEGESQRSTQSRDDDSQKDSQGSSKAELGSTSETMDALAMELHPPSSPELARSNSFIPPFKPLSETEFEELTSMVPTSAIMSFTDQFGTIGSIAATSKSTSAIDSSGNSTAISERVPPTGDGSDMTSGVFSGPMSVPPASPPLAPVLPFSDSSGGSPMTNGLTSPMLGDIGSSLGSAGGGTDAAGSLSSTDIGGPSSSSSSLSLSSPPPSTLGSKTLSASSLFGTLSGTFSSANSFSRSDSLTAIFADARTNSMRVPTLPPVIPASSSMLPPSTASPLKFVPPSSQMLNGSQLQTSTKRAANGVGHELVAPPNKRQRLAPPPMPLSSLIQPLPGMRLSSTSIIKPDPSLSTSRSNSLSQPSSQENSQNSQLSQLSAHSLAHSYTSQSPPREAEAPLVSSSSSRRRRSPPPLLDDELPPLSSSSGTSSTNGHHRSVSSTVNATSSSSSRPHKKRRHNHDHSSNGGAPLLSRQPPTPDLSSLNGVLRDLYEKARRKNEKQNCHFCGQISPLDKRVVCQNPYCSLQGQKIKYICTKCLNYQKSYFKKIGIDWRNILGDPEKPQWYCPACVQWEDAYLPYPGLCCCSFRRWDVACQIHRDDDCDFSIKASSGSLKKNFHCKAYKQKITQNKSDKMRDIRLDIRRIRMSRGSQPYVRSYKRDELEPTYRSLTGENGAPVVLDADLSPTMHVKAEPAVDCPPMPVQPEQQDEDGVLGGAAAFSSSKPRTNAPFIKKSRHVQKRSDLVEHPRVNATRDHVVESGDPPGAAQREEILPPREYATRSRCSSRRAHAQHAARNSRVHDLSGDRPFPFPDRVRSSAPTSSPSPITKASVPSRGSSTDSALSAHDASIVASAVQKAATTSLAEAQDHSNEHDVELPVGRPPAPKRTRSLLDTLSDAADEEGRRNKIAKRENTASCDANKNTSENAKNGVDNESRGSRLPKVVLNDIQPPSPAKAPASAKPQPDRGEPQPNGGESQPNSGAAGIPPSAPERSPTMTRTSTVVVDHDQSDEEATVNVATRGDSVSTSKSSPPSSPSTSSVSSSDENLNSKTSGGGGGARNGEDAVKRAQTAPIAGQQQGHHTQHAHAKAIREAATAGKKPPGKLARSGSLNNLAYLAAWIRDFGDLEKSA